MTKTTVALVVGVALCALGGATHAGGKPMLSCDSGPYYYTRMSLKRTAKGYVVRIHSPTVMRREKGKRETRLELRFGAKQCHVSPKDKKLVYCLARPARYRTRGAGRAGRWASRTAPWLSLRTDRLRRDQVDMSKRPVRHKVRDEIELRVSSATDKKHGKLSLRVVMGYDRCKAN